MVIGTYRKGAKSVQSQIVNINMIHITDIQGEKTLSLRRFKNILIFYEYQKHRDHRTR